jgi:hypothetical protein
MAPIHSNIAQVVSGTSIATIKLPSGFSTTEPYPNSSKKGKIIDYLSGLPDSGADRLDNSKCTQQEEVSFRKFISKTIVLIRHVAYNLM